MKVPLRGKVLMLFSRVDFEHCCKLEELCSSMKLWFINNFVSVKMEDIDERVSCTVKSSSSSIRVEISAERSSTRSILSRILSLNGNILS